MSIKNNKVREALKSIPSIDEILNYFNSSSLPAAFAKFHINKTLKKIRTDFKNELIVSFNGSIPNLFEEGKGVVAEGFLKDRSYLKAVKILAKHDENYMPPEVSEALKDNKQ